jgi:hypothetical protein
VIISLQVEVRCGHADLVAGNQTISRVLISQASERQRIGSQIDAAFIPCVYEVRPRGDVTFNHKILLVMSTTD